MSPAGHLAAGTACSPKGRPRYCGTSPHGKQASGHVLQVKRDRVPFSAVGLSVSAVAAAGVVRLSMGKRDCRLRRWPMIVVRHRPGLLPRRRGRNLPVRCGRARISSASNRVRGGPFRPGHERCRVTYRPREDVPSRRRGTGLPFHRVRTLGLPTPLVVPALGNEARSSQHGHSLSSHEVTGGDNANGSPRLQHHAARHVWSAPTATSCQYAPWRSRMGNDETPAENLRRVPITKWRRTSGLSKR